MSGLKSNKNSVCFSLVWLERMVFICSQEMNEFDQRKVLHITQGLIQRHFWTPVRLWYWLESSFEPSVSSKYHCNNRHCLSWSWIFAEALLRMVIELEKIVNFQHLWCVHFFVLLVIVHNGWQWCPFWLDLMKNCWNQQSQMTIHLCWYGQNWSGWL